MTQTFGENCPQFSKSSVAVFAIGAGFFLLSLVLHATCWWRKRIKKKRGQYEETTGLLASREIPRPLPRDPSTMAALVASGEYLDLDETLTRSMSKSGSFYESIPGGYYPMPMVTGKPELPPPRVPKRNQVAGTRNGKETREGYATVDDHRYDMSYEVPETTKHNAGTTLSHGTPPHYPNRQRAYKIHRASKAGNAYITANPDFEMSYGIPVTENGKTGTSAETFKLNDTERTTFELSYEVPNVSSMVNSGTARSADLRKLNGEANDNSYEIPDITIKSTTDLLMSPSTSGMENYFSYKIPPELPAFSMKSNTTVSAQALRVDGAAKSADEITFRVLDNFAEGTCATITDETILPEKLKFMPVTVLNVDTSNITQEPTADTEHEDYVESELQDLDVMYAPQSKIYATAHINTGKPPELPPRLHQPRVADNEPDINITDGKNKEQANTTKVTEKYTVDDNGTEQLGEMEESLGPPDAPAPPIPRVHRVPERRPIKK